LEAIKGLGSGKILRREGTEMRRSEDRRWKTEDGRRYKGKA